MRILLTNDDGIDAPGMRALIHAVADFGDVFVVAPMEAQSAMSHAATFHRPVTTRPFPIYDEGRAIGEGVAVDGRPADCVKLAVNYLHGEVDLVVSGVNAGANVGVNVSYSGTVGAAREAAILGLPAVAMSLHIGDPTKTDWPAASACAREQLAAIFDDARDERSDPGLQGAGGERPDHDPRDRTDRPNDPAGATPIDAGLFLNVNIPILDDGRRPREPRFAPLSCAPLIDFYHQQHGEDGARTYTVGDSLAFRQTPEGSDVDLLFKGHVTITPLTLDATDHARLQRLAARRRAGNPT